MAAEQPRDEQGQFAAAPAEGAPDAPGAAPPQAEAEPQKYRVLVDGEEHYVTHDEALAGYMRQQTFTKRSQERERMLEQREAALRGGLQPGLGTVAGPSYPATGPNSGGWPAVGGGAPPTYEQPAQGTTVPQYAPPPVPAEYASGEEEYVRPAQLQAVTRQMAQMHGELVAERQAVAQMKHEQEQESRIGQLAGELPGFNRATCDEKFYMLPPHEQERYANIPKATAYELLHLRYCAAPGGTQATGGAPTPGTPTPATFAAAAPPAEAGTARNTAPGVAPIVMPSDGDDIAGMVTVMEQAENAGVPGV